MYKLIKKIQEQDLKLTTTWAEHGTAGRKPLLSNHGLQELIRDIKLSTDGGYALSHKDLRELVKAEIKEEWSAKYRLHLFPNIPIKTLNAYASIVKSQSIFNVHDNVLNKTQSRVIAEWSFRSTISFLMAILATHYIPDVSSTAVHTRRRDLSKEALQTLEMVERQYNKMIGNERNMVKKLTPVLPNLITSTDKVTIFASSSVIHGKDSYYIVSKPTYIKNEQSNSGSRNHYKKKPSGDSHCCSVRIVLNCTFTAGGLSSPLFVVVYGMSADEMPNEEIVTVEVPGLTVGGDLDVYSEGKGFITFVCGREESDDVEDCSDTNVSNQEDDTPSKEARIASLYRRLVYHPFIEHIRKVKYGYNPDTCEEVPDHL